MSVRGPLFTFWLRKVPSGRDGRETYELAVQDDAGWRFNLVGHKSEDGTEIWGEGHAIPPGPWVQV